MDSLLSRITYDQRVLRGKPVIRGMRISVEMILELIAKGSLQDEILEDYPQLEPDDLRAAEEKRILGDLGGALRRPNPT